MMHKLINDYDEKELCLYLLYFVRYRLFKTFFIIEKKIKIFRFFFVLARVQKKV